MLGSEREREEEVKAGNALTHDASAKHRQSNCMSMMLVACVRVCVCVCGKVSARVDEGEGENDTIAAPSISLSLWPKCNRQSTCRLKSVKHVCMYVCVFAGARASLVMLGRRCRSSGCLSLVSTSVRQSTRQTRRDRVLRVN